MRQMPATYKPAFVPLKFTPPTTPQPSPLREVVISNAFVPVTVLMNNYARAVAPRIPLLSRDKGIHGP
jgi:hypothetical protein